MAARWFGMRYRYCVVPDCTNAHLGNQVFCWDHTVAFHVLDALGVAGEIADAVYGWWKATEGALRAS